MSCIEFNLSNIPVTGQYEVIVAGGGTAGAVAAASSAREGLKTLVIEQLGALGGTETFSLVTPMMPNGIEGNPSSSAISEEICDRMIQYGYGLDTGDKYPRWYRGWFDPQILKVVLEDIAVEAGCEILYHTSVIGVIKEGSRIKYAVIHNKDGISAVEGKCFVDCTGDADVAYLAGVPTFSGNDEGMNQAVSLRFQMTNVNTEAVGHYLLKLGASQDRIDPFVRASGARGNKGLLLSKLLEEKFEEGVLTSEDVKYFQMMAIPGKPKDIAFNCPELGGQKNVIDAKYLSRKQIQGKKAVIRMVGFLKKHVPGFEDAYVCDIASLVGIRESRRIKAEYELTAEDIFEHRKFHDGIAISNYPVDVHGAGKGKSYTYKDVDKSQRFYEVPYRSLVAAGIDNLVTAGRCIGADFIAQSSVRVQHTCRATGEAAGIAAALSVKNGIACREVNGQEIKKKMLERGAEFS